MRNAPSVSFPVGRSSFEGRVLAGLALASGAALAAWRWQTEPSNVLVACLLAFWLVGCGLAWRQWRASPVGALHWRDGAWTWGAPQAGAEAGRSLTRLRVALDFQNVLLLDVALAGPGPGWLWLARRDDPAHWNALRRAVHGRFQASSAGGPAAAGTGARA